MPERRGNPESDFVMLKDGEKEAFGPLPSQKRALRSVSEGTPSLTFWEDVPSLTLAGVLEGSAPTVPCWPSAK